MAKDVRVAILGDSSDFSRAVSSANRDAAKLESGFAKAGGGISKIAGSVALGAGAVAVGGVALGKTFVDAAIESQKVTAQTDAVIKSMGNTANVSAEQVADLSTKLSLKSGVDDELIQSGSNVLLTFGKIRNEVGKGNDIFDRANAAALDMSVALGTDMASASMQVGKALNDPVRGLAALRRSGIQFTAQQEAQIKTMVAAGDTAGAQKVMLAELERQFGGSAAAQATASDKLKVAWGNIQEQLGAKLLPVVEKVATFLADNLPGAMARAEEVSTRVAAAVREHWPQIQAVITGAVENVRVVVEGVVSVVQTLWQNFGDNILSFVQRVWPAIQQTISGALEMIRGVVQVITSLIKGDWSGVWEGIKSIVHGAFDLIVGRIKTAMELLRLAISIPLEVIRAMWDTAWSGVSGALSTVWETIKSTASSGIQTVVGWVTAMPGMLGGALSGLAASLSAPFRGAFNRVAGYWNDTVGSLSFKVPSWVPVFGGNEWNVPDIPTLHSGTDFFRPPGGAREGLALLERGEQVIPKGGGGGVHITINGNVDDGLLRDLVYTQKKLMAVRLGAAA